MHSPGYVHLQSDLLLFRQASTLCARAAAGRSLVRLYLGNDGRAGFGQCCMWWCSNHNTLQHSVLLGPVVPMMAGCTGSLCLAFPAVFHLESCSHTFSQATPVSFFFVKNYHLWNAGNEGIIAYPEVEHENRQSQWLHYLSPHRHKEILNHSTLEFCLNCNTLFCIYFKKSKREVGTMIWWKHKWRMPSGERK